MYSTPFCILCLSSSLSSLNSSCPSILPAFWLQLYLSGLGEGFYCVRLLVFAQMS